MVYNARRRRGVPDAGDGPRAMLSKIKSLSCVLLTKPTSLRISFSVQGSGSAGAGKRIMVKLVYDAFLPFVSPRAGVKEQWSTVL